MENNFKLTQEILIKMWISRFKVELDFDKSRFVDINLLNPKKRQYIENDLSLEIILQSNSHKTKQS